MIDSNSEMNGSEVKPIDGLSSTFGSWFGFAVAGATVGAGILIRYLLDPFLGQAGSPFVTFYPAVALAVFFGRARAGLLGTILSLLAGDFLFVTPRFSWGTQGKADAALIAVFLVSAVLIVFLGEAMHRARQRAEVLRRDQHATEQKARQIVQSAEEQVACFAFLVENSTEFIGICDLEGRPTFLNRAGQKLVGLAPADLPATRLTDFFFLEDQSFIRDDFLPRVLHEGRGEVEIRFRHMGTGQPLWMVFSVILLRDAAGRPLGFATISKNISDRKRWEQNLESKIIERTARLHDVVHELEVFSYSIAHDLRAPLRAMQGLSNAVLEDCEELLPAQPKEHLRRIANSASLLDRQILNVLSYSQLLGGELPLESVDANAVLREVIGSYPNLRACREYIHIETPIPPLLANRGALSQVVSNLLSNAIKFVAPDVRPNVRIQVERQGAKVRIGFKDNGIGISQKGQKRLFELFQRLHPLDVYEGTGIGLAIVKKAVERMGGVVGVISEPGCGSEFWIQLNAPEDGAAAMGDRLEAEEKPARQELTRDLSRGTLFSSPV